jgi:hypothetical protein
MWTNGTDTIVGFLGTQPIQYYQLKTASPMFDRALRQEFSRLIYLLQAFKVLVRHTKGRLAQRLFRESGDNAIRELYQGSIYARPSNEA